MDLLPDLLLIVGTLVAAAGTAALALAVVELAQRWKRRMAALGLDGTLAADAGGASSLAALRRAVIAPLAALAERTVPEKFLLRLEAQLEKAGNPNDVKPAELCAFMLLSFVGFAGLWVLLGGLRGELDEVFLVGFVVCDLLGAGYPLLWLRDKVRFRQHQIVRALPYDLDLLTLSVEAGLDFTAALGKVVEKGRKGPLADELSITLKELKLGKTREEALHNLAARVDLPSLTTFVNALIQADKMGTPLGKILRILSTQMRVERTQRAEKLANEAPVKLLLPLIGFIFPTLFLILFGPIAYQVFYGG